MPTASEQALIDDIKERLTALEAVEKRIAALEAIAQALAEQPDPDADVTASSIAHS